MNCAVGHFQCSSMLGGTSWLNPSQGTIYSYKTQNTACSPSQPGQTNCVLSKQSTEGWQRHCPLPVAIPVVWQQRNSSALARILLKGKIYAWHLQIHIRGCKEGAAVTWGDPCWVPGGKIHLCVPSVISVALLSPFSSFPLEGGWLFLAQRVFLGQVVQELLRSLVIMDCQQPEEGSSAQHLHCKER